MAGDYVTVFTSYVIYPHLAFSQILAHVTVYTMEAPNLKKRIANNAYGSVIIPCSCVEMKCIELQKYLRKTMRLLLDDGRTVEGRLQVRFPFIVSRSVLTPRSI